MSRTALRDRNNDDTSSTAEAFRRIKAIREGKAPRSDIFEVLSPQQQQPSPQEARLGTSSSTGGDKENNDAMSDSDDDGSSAVPVPRKKKGRRLVRKSQLVEDDDDDDDDDDDSRAPPPPPAAAPHPPSSSAPEDVVDLTEMMSSLGGIGGSEPARSRSVVQPPFSPVVPVTRGEPRTHVKVSLSSTHAASTASASSSSSSGSGSGPGSSARARPLPTADFGATPTKPRVMRPVPAAPPATIRATAAPPASSSSCPVSVPVVQVEIAAEVRKPKPMVSAPPPVSGQTARPASCSSSSSVAAAVPTPSPAPASGPRPMRLKGRGGGPKFELHGELAARLYDHQRDGVRWMWNLQLQGRGGILADDMGLGKTLQVAAFAAGLLRSRAAKRILVLAPTTLLPHWGKEFVVAGLKEGVNLHKFAGGGSKAERDRALSRVASNGGVLLTTYGMVLHNATQLGAPEAEEDAEAVAAASGRGAAVAMQDYTGSGLTWDWIVCDEGHKLKNPNAQLPQRVRILPSFHRLIITGTPIQNHLAELWALYDLCCPGLLGDEVEFRREYSKKIAAGQSRDATERQRSAGARASEELRRVCRPFMLRREKASVLAKATTEDTTTTKKQEESSDNSRGKETVAGQGASAAVTAAPSSSSSSMEEASSTSTSAPTASSSATATKGWAGVKHAPTQLGVKNDLIVWLPLRPAQKRLYKKFLKSGPVRSALNKTGSALSAINVLKKICDHPALCCAVAETTAAAAAATSTYVKSPSKSPGGSGSGSGGGDDEKEEDEDNEGKQAAVAAAVAAAGLTEADLEGDPEASGKAAFLMSLLRHLADHGHRTLVFSQSRAMLDVLERAARSDGHNNLVRIDGQVPAEERHARVERFQNDPDIPLALLTSQVGGLGLTLTAADRVVIYDPAWNPAADSQSVDRAYRIGQTRDVVVYRLVTCGTVEEKVYRRQVFKGGLSRAGTQDGNHFRYFSAEETSQLFEVTEEGLNKSITQVELERLHASQRKWTEELRDVEAPLLQRLGAAGVSDHDLLFSKEDTTKAGSGATMLSGGDGGAGKSGAGKGGGAGGGGGKMGGGGKGAWRGVDAGWGGSAELAGLAKAAESAVAVTCGHSDAPPSPFMAAGKNAFAAAAAAAAAATTKSKVEAKLQTLRQQRDKQKMLLSMPGMMKKLPDGGANINARIEALNAEITKLEAEAYEKHGIGSKPEVTEPVEPEKPTPESPQSTTMVPTPAAASVACSPAIKKSPTTTASPSPTLAATAAPNSPIPSSVRGIDEADMEEGEVTSPTPSFIRRAATATESTAASEASPAPTAGSPASVAPTASPAPTVSPSPPSVAGTADGEEEEDEEEGRERVVDSPETESIAGTVEAGSPAPREDDIEEGDEDGDLFATAPSSPVAGGRQQPSAAAAAAAAEEVDTLTDLLGGMGMGRT